MVCIISKEKYFLKRELVFEFWKTYKYSQNESLDNPSNSNRKSESYISEKNINKILGIQNQVRIEPMKLGFTTWKTKHEKNFVSKHIKSISYKKYHKSGSEEIQLLIKMNRGLWLMEFPKQCMKNENE